MTGSPSPHGPDGSRVRPEGTPPDDGRSPRAMLLRLAAPAGALAVVSAAFWFVATVDPNQPGHYPPGPLLYFTGILCPGCGGLRAAHAVAHGDLALALSSNALAVAGFAAFAAGWILWVVRTLRGQPVTVPLRGVHWWLLGALALAFTVVRNLPFGTALAP